MAEQKTKPPTPEDVRQTLHQEAKDRGTANSAAKPDGHRSADANPLIESEEDLERVTSDQKPTAHEGLSSEAQKQIAEKLKNKKGQLESRRR